jgi:predicted transcriptional regulator
MQFDIISTMTKMFKEAMTVLRELPEERQETIARAILDFASHDDEACHLNECEQGEVRAGLVDIERGDIASDEEIQNVYKRINVVD